MENMQYQNLSELGETVTVDNIPTDLNENKDFQNYQFYSQLYKKSILFFSVFSLIFGCITILMNLTYLESNKKMMVILIIYSCIELNCFIVNLVIFGIMYFIIWLIRKPQLLNYLLGVCFIIFQVMISILYLSLIPTTYEVFYRIFQKTPIGIRTFMMFQSGLIICLFFLQFKLLISNQTESMHMIQLEGQQNSKLDMELMKRIKKEVEDVKFKTGKQFF